MSLPRALPPGECGRSKCNPPGRRAPPAPYGTDQHQHERSDYDPDQRRLIQLHGGWVVCRHWEMLMEVGKGPGRRLSPRRGPRCPTSTFGGVQVGRNGETPARTLQFLCVPEHSSVTWRAAGQGPVGRGPQACFAKLTLGLHSLARLRAENISPVFARPRRSSLQRPE